jgi:hypothetical protein
MLRGPLACLPFALLACQPPDRPGFGSGGEPWTEPEDTASYDLAEIAGPEDILGNAALLACMERGAVEAIAGSEPPTVEGLYNVHGEVVASDTWPVGTEVGSEICLFEQTADGTIAVRETGSHITWTTNQAWIRGEGSSFSTYLEILFENTHGAGCVVQSLGVLTGEVEDAGELTLRTAVVPVGSDGCAAEIEAAMGSCWATADTATPTGTCAG